MHRVVGREQPRPGNRSALGRDARVAVGSQHDDDGGVGRPRQLPHLGEPPRRGAPGACGEQHVERPERRRRGLQQDPPLLVHHHEAELALVLVAQGERLVAILALGARLLPRRGTEAPCIERFLQRVARVRRHPARDHPREQARLLGEAGIEEFLDLVAGVAIAEEGDSAERDAEQAEHEQQGAATDRAHQTLSTR